jgi:hypothetical protein
VLLSLISFQCKDHPSLLFFTRLAPEDVTHLKPDLKDGSVVYKCIRCSFEQTITPEANGNKNGEYPIRSLNFSEAEPECACTTRRPGKPFEKGSP